MAAPHVEIVSAQNFGCVLRDRNQRHDNVFEKNLKAPVKDHHHHHHHRHHHHHQFFNRIPVESSVSDENSENRIDSWIANQQKQNRNNRLRPPEFRHPKKDSNFSDSVSANLPPRESHSRKDRSENSKRNDNIGASSLVQIWEARLNRSNGGNPPSQDQSTASSSRRSSGVSVQETLYSGHSIDGESKNHDQTVEIESESFCSVSDSGDSKWGRVADIIKQLSNEQKPITGKNGGVTGLPTIKIPRPCISSCSSTVSEKSIFPVVTSSPRIRGRQAFTDLLMQLERDRHRELDSLLERNAVSKFSQRGRLQSMLRLRSLQRCIAIQDRHRSKVIASDSNRQETISAVLHLRERCWTKATTKQQDQDNNKPLVAESSNDLPEASITERLTSLNHNVDEAKLCKNGENDTKGAKSENEDNNGIPTTESKEENNMTNQDVMYLERQETSSMNEWEEYEDEQSDDGATNYDWFSEICRPREYWEDLRKNRYIEVMNTQSEKHDIRRLLERRTVSSFLESDLRENIDRLMMSRIQKQPIQRNKWEIMNQEEEKIEVEVEVEEEQERDDVSHTSSQMFSPSPGGSWSSRDMGDNTSTPLLPIHTDNSPEMELINEMRTQIQQLQREMSELRDSVQTCMDANTRLQQSAHQENPLKRKCCVCNETQVDSLLYRCGHMCTCLKCANELQWNNGKCPICRAQILDVVRVFIDQKD